MDDLRRQSVKDSHPTLQGITTDEYLDALDPSPEQVTAPGLGPSIEIEGKKIPAGAHTLYIVPSESGVSKLAFSSNIGKWGIPVDETRDVARVTLKKEPMAQPVNQLTIAIENQPPATGVLKIMWENTQFSVPFTVQK
jgi:hypothetical protein